MNAHSPGREWSDAPPSRRNPDIQDGHADRAWVTPVHNGLVPLETLQAMCLAVSRAPELAGALNDVLDGVLALTHAEIGAIRLVHDGRCDRHPVASRGRSSRFQATECPIAPGVCGCGPELIDDEPVVIDDLASSRRVVRPACMDERVGSLVTVPCRSRGRTFGLLTLYAVAPGAFAGVDRALWRAIGLHLGTAIDNAEWSASARERAVADERQVLAGELHDGVAQSLAYVSVQVARVQVLLERGAADTARREMAAVREGIQRANNDVRRLLADFRIAPSPSGTFGDALHEQTDAFAARTGIRVHLVGEDHASALSPPQQVEVFRIIQEALANVQKHARASTVWVTCERRNDRCLLSVRDDGDGFDVAAVRDSGGFHVGTSLIRERAARIHGPLTIDSHPGVGTTVSVSVPFPFAEERSLR